MEKYNVPVVSSQGKSLEFEDFSMTYMGSEHYQHPQISISTDTRTFEVKDSKGVIQKVLVKSGQLPPQPQNFSVNGKNFTIFTYVDLNGKRLEPGHILIQAK